MLYKILKGEAMDLNHKQARTVAAVLLSQLKLWGIKRIYGVTGDAIFGLMDALGKDKDIRFIAVKHETTAALMASTEARLTGKPGVCVSQMGPGMGNLLNGLGDAHLDRCPVLAITGQAPLNKIGTDYKQYINQQDFIQPLACYSSLLCHPDAISDVLGKALTLSCIRRDVAHLSIPQDLFFSNTAVEPLPPPPFPNIMPSSEDFHLFIKTMKQAIRPVIIVGQGGKDAGPMLEQLAEKWGAPLIVSPDGNGLIPHASPYFLGGIGEGGNPFVPSFIEQADLVLFVGTTWWPEGYVPEHIIKIQIDQFAENRVEGPVQGMLLGNIREIVENILRSHFASPQSNEWVEAIQKVKNQWSQENEREGRQEGSPLPPPAIIRAIENSCDENAIVTLDYGDSTIWFYRNFRPAMQEVLLSSQWRTMGFSLPAAMAAKLTNPERQIIAIAGDGGLEMVLAELLTASRYHLKITLIVFNNGTLQMELDKMVLEGLTQEGVTLTNPDFVLLAQACGWDGYRVEHSSELEQVMQNALTSPNPSLIDVYTEQTIHPDFIVNKPLQ